MLLEQVPDIEAVHTQPRSCGPWGCGGRPAQHGVYEIAATTWTGLLHPPELVAKERSAFVLVGPLLARTGEVMTGMPGGDRIGARPVNVGVRGLEALGVETQHVDGTYYFRSQRPARGPHLPGLPQATAGHREPIWRPAWPTAPP